MWGRLGLIAVLAGGPGASAAQDFFTLKGHGGPVMEIAVSPSGQVASASFDNSIGLWTGRTPRWLEGHDAAVVTVAFVGDGALVSGGDDFAVILWRDGKPRVLGRHKGKVADLAVSPDRRTVASASWDGTVGLWPLSGGEGRMIEVGAGVNAVAFSRDGRHLFAATKAGEILDYDPASGALRAPVVRHGFGVNVMVLGPGDHWLAYGAVDGGTRVMDPATGAEIADFTLDRRPILSMAFSAATRRLAVGDGQGYIMVIDTENWTIEKDFRAMREGPVWALAYATDGRTLYAGGLDPVIYGWPVALLDAYEPGPGAKHDFLRDTATMPNGERQFMRKCSICHALTAGASRKAGPTLYGVFGRRAGSVPGYRYSARLDGSEIVWSDRTIDELFRLGPDHYIPGSKMPMQRIAGAQDRADLIVFLKQATRAAR